MIPISLFDHQKTELDYKVIEFINENLKAIIEEFIEYLNGNDGIEVSEKLMGVLPRDYIVRKPEECKRIVDELYEIVGSPVLRDLIKPKYQYLLYHLLLRWKELSDDGFVESILPIGLTEQLKNEISSCKDYIFDDGHNLIIGTIQDFDGYFDICFYDHDFLMVENLVDIYLRTPMFMETVFSDVNLDDYVDLMPPDLRELYFERKKNPGEMGTFKNKGNLDVEYKVVVEFYSAILLLQNQAAELYYKSESEINNEIFRMLKRLFKSLNLEIEREAQIGRAKVDLGESDFFIYSNDKSFLNIAIVESKPIERFIDGYKQLLGYLNPSFMFGITISINKNKQLGAAFDFIKGKLGISHGDFKLVKIVENPLGDKFKYILKSEHVLPEDGSRIMSIYHLVINLYDFSRKGIAAESRKSR